MYKFEEKLALNYTSNTHNYYNKTILKQTLCRICLEKESAIAFLSIITFENQTQLEIAKAVQYLTGETLEEIQNPKLPKQICGDCINLILQAQKFKQKYEKSSQILKEFLLQENNPLIPKNIETIVDIKTEVDEDLIIDDNTTNVYHFDAIDQLNNMKVTLSHLENAEKLLKKYNPKLTNKPKLHICPICLDKFTALELKKHCRAHTALHSYFNSAPKFNKKVKFYAKPRTEKENWFNTKKITHTCQFCFTDFSGVAFWIHALQHKSEMNYKCNVCNRIFLRRNTLKVHQIKHKKEFPYICQECGKGFCLQKNLNFHKLTHTGATPYKCDQCPKSFYNPEYLRRHKFLHEKSINYNTYYSNINNYITCKQCLQKFKSQEKMKQHNCKLACGKCHKLFDKKKDFSSHVCKFKMHPSTCVPCSKVFQLPSSFKVHKSRCKQTIKTLCYVCGKNVCNLTNHLYSHYPQKRNNGANKTIEKQTYVCSKCGNQFRHLANYYRHIKEIHVRKISFKCKYCFKEFRSKSNGKIHELIHEGKKDAVCVVCGKKFLHIHYLKRHLKKVHNNIVEPKRVKKDDKNKN